MPRIFRKATAVALVVAIALVLGLTSVGAFAHEVNHAAHHSPGMHQTGICAWMCATSGAIATFIVQPFPVDRLEIAVASPVFPLRPLLLLPCVQARAPPVSPTVLP